MIESVDTLGVCGWVVDLRGNLGGNMWPMVAGAGPIVGEGVLGHFIDPDSVVQTWTYVFGGSRLDDQILTRVSDPYRLLEEDPVVAVLTDSLTASSGEATTIAFRGREQTRSFGGATWGVSTANRSFTLSDGAMIFLTVSTMADRTGQLYGSKVVPDQTVEGPRTGDPDTDPALRAGLEWVVQQGACSRQLGA
jgi:C-terminal processing protease CtpA/Prc